MKVIQILGSILFPLILLGFLAVEILDWLAYKTGITMANDNEVKVVKCLMAGCALWLILGVLVIIYLIIKL